MKIKVTLSGTTLKIMGWDTCPNPDDNMLWQIWNKRAIEKKRGKGYFREIDMARSGVENTMDAVEEKLWSEKLQLPMPHYTAMLRDAEKLRAALAEFPIEDDLPAL